MFVNRINELEALNREYRSDKSTFSIIYGRRRVGKTALITEYIKDKPHIYLYITQGDLRAQLDIFVQELAKFVDPAVAQHLKFERFEEALDFLVTLRLEEKLVVVIDEYQYLVDLDPAFSSKLQRLWDTKLSKANLHLILCGSVYSMMLSETLRYDAPLYGRRTSQFHIRPLLFRHIAEFIPGLDRLEQMQVFASFGTIPKYLMEYDGKLGFFENIARKILDKNSYLYAEGKFLIKEEIKEPVTYFSILQSIANGNRKIGHIASSLGVNSSYLSKYMLRLIELDIVRKEIPVTETNPSKSRFGLYRIQDKFLDFWFYYVYKNYTYLEIGEVQTVMEEIEKNFNDRFVAFAFEDYMRESIRTDPRHYLPFVPKKIGRWWNNKEEIDIVAFDDENIAFIECKWRNSVDRERELQRLIAKAAPLVGSKKAHYRVVTKRDYLDGSV